jgi:hypothetical protein
LLFGARPTLGALRRFSNKATPTPQGEETKEAPAGLDEDDGLDEDEEEYVDYEEGKGYKIYEGNLASPVRVIKLFSVSSCTMSVIAAPVDDLHTSNNPNNPAPSTLTTLISKESMTTLIGVGVSERPQFLFDRKG